MFNNLISAIAKHKKLICIILAAVVGVTAIAGVLVYAFGRYGKKNFALRDLPVSQDNYVSFRKGVHIADDPEDIQEDFEDVSVTDAEYTLIYDDDIPEFFSDMAEGDVFCVYPDSDATESFFALGFCGRLTGIGESDVGHTVSFTIPELTDVFSDMCISTNTPTSAAFYPSDNVTEVQKGHATPASAGGRGNHMGLAAVSPLLSFEIDETVGYTFKEPETASLLDDYALLCDELSLKFDCTITGPAGVSLGAEGSVSLEETAVKMLLNYHYDEATDTVEVNDYSMGFITKQKADLTLTGGIGLGLDDLEDVISLDASDIPQIIEIEDVTASESGKIVLGTFLIGWQPALPILQNDTNKVSYLSFGLAIQLSLTGRGELSLEYSLEESGFAQFEINSNGDSTCLVKGYEYPNPVTESRLPTEKEQDSTPTVTSTAKGEAQFNLALGVDAGLCVLGMLPLKLSNNLVELEFAKTLFYESDKDETVTVMSNNYLVDDTVDRLMFSTNSFLKMHLGAKLDFGTLKYTLGEFGGSVQLFKKVWYQTPPAVGFSHSQCGFGGVYVGEVYSDEELSEAYATYMEDTDQDSLTTSAMDAVFGSIVDTMLNDLGLDITDITDLVGDGIDGCTFDYYTSGILYVRDENNRVVEAFVTGDQIGNISGVHNGLSSTKIEQIYSSPDQYAEVDLNFGSVLWSLLGIDWLDDTNLAASIYRSSDSDDAMLMVFHNDELVLIILAAEGQ